MTQKKKKGLDLFAVINLLNFIGGFIITMYNVYTVIDSIKTARKANIKQKKNKLGF